MFCIKKLMSVGVLCLCLWIRPVFVEAKEIQKAFGLLANVTASMQDVGFWIAKHPYPDKTILLLSEINAFNEKTQQQGLLFDLKNYPLVVDKKQMRYELLFLLGHLRHKVLFNTKGYQQGASFFIENFFKHINKIPQRSFVRYGFVVKETAQRFLPTEQALYTSKHAHDFDELQNSVLAIAEPVVILYETIDQEWFFVKNKIAQGWVRSKDVAITTKEDFIKQLEKQSINPGVIIVPRASLYSDEGMKMFIGSVRMGSLFVLKGSGVKAIEVALPKRDSLGNMFLSSAFIAREDVSIGFLPFNARTMLIQAFKMLHAPYGWGDINGAQDCSRFLQMIFATVGIELPRNSSQQALVGLELATFEPQSDIERKKELLLRQGIGGITLLQMPGHVMLYLGQENRNPYVIHATWAYREMKENIEISHLVQKVVVSDLMLSEQSRKGSLLKRLSNVRLIGLPVERAILK